jgi:hypothetical protein
MDDRIFKVELERSRIYWDYYKAMFLVFSTALSAGMVSAAVIYTKGEISLTIAAGIILLLALCVILLSAIMSLTIWRHENRYLDELVRAEEEDRIERPAGGPLV